MSAAPDRRHRWGQTLTHPTTGVTKTIGDWAAELGIPYTRLHYRVVVARMPLERALTSERFPVGCTPSMADAVSGKRRGRPRGVENGEHEGVELYTLECVCGCRRSKVLQPELTVRQAVAGIVCPKCGRIGEWRLAKTSNVTATS